MDLSPPELTRSPASPPNTYCPSERSCLEYPSPVLVDQHYKLESLFPEQSCSMAQLDTTSLPPLDSTTPADWHSPTLMAPGSTSSAIPNIVSAEYDPFASYGSPMPSHYSHESYPPPPSHSPAVAHSPLSTVDGSGRSPAPSAARTSVPFPHNSVSASLAPRVKLESAGDYSHAVEVAHYPSPRSINAPFGTDSGPYSATQSTYLTENHGAAWSKQDCGTETFYHPAAPQTSSFIGKRPPFRVRPRRPPRRLTTKEEANFQCEVKGCGKLFSRSYNFKAHMETHDEKREYPFPCPVNDCNKKFVRKTDLQRHHQSVHMKERNHRCEFCGRLFARKDTLRRHMEDGCSKRFDIGTLDLRAETYDAMAAGRGVGLHMSHVMHHASVLPPPMAIPPAGNTGLLTSGSQPMRRGVSAGNNCQSSVWR